MDYSFNRTSVKKLLLITALSSSVVGFGQIFPGLRSGNYTGVTSVLSNPANIAASKYKWDVNLISLHTLVGNNNGSFNLSNINDLLNSESNILFEGSGDRTANALVFADILLPSFMVTLNPKTSIALTSRVRVMANVNGLDANLIDAIETGENNTLPYTFTSSGLQKIAATGWTELGASLGRVLVSKDKHFVKAGVSVKYLGGSANTFLNLNNIRGTIAEDVNGNAYLTNASGTIGLGYAGIPIDSDEGVSPFGFNGKGLGADLGLVYEYRPNAGEAGSSANSPYAIKASLSVVDLGSIKFTPDANQFGNYSFNIGPMPDRLDLNQFEGRNVEEIKGILDRDPRFVNNLGSGGTYKAGMPATVQAALDWAISRRFFAEVHFMTGISNTKDAYTVYMPTAISVTPRFETRGFGAYLPLNYNDLTGFNAGIALRAGPLFIGSGSLLTAAFGNSKQADVLFGLRFGGLKK